MSHAPTSTSFASRVILITLSLTLWPAASAVFGQTEQPNEVRELPPGQTLEREMTGAETHRYKFDLQANEFFQVRVEQKGIDVLLKLLGANGQVVARMGSPSERQGPETLSFVMEKSGSFVLELSGFDVTAEKGNYTIKREASRTATRKDKRRVEIEWLFVEGMTARDVVGQEETAIKKFSEAQAGWQELADSYMAELTAQHITLIKIRLLIREGTAESFRVALAKVEETSRLYRASGNTIGEAVSLAQAGIIYSELGEKAAALRSYERALSLFRGLLNKIGEARTLHNIGVIYSDLGERQKALSYFNQALELYKAVDNRIGEASTLTAIGETHSNLGEDHKALSYYNQALQLYKAVNDKRGEARTLTAIGWAYYNLRENQKALDYLNRALSLHKDVSDKKWKAMALTGMGWVYFTLRENQEALSYFNQALPIQRIIGDKGGEAWTLAAIGAVYFALGEKQTALVYNNQALQLHRVVGSKSGEAWTLSYTMVVWEAFNNRRMAVFYGKQSVNKYQELRQAIQSLDKGTQKTFLAKIENVYKRLADILITDGRLPEAEQVLAMLKEEEVFDYLRRDASEADKLGQRADLTKEEAEALRRYNEFADRITALGAEFGRLQELRGKGVKLTEEQEKRSHELSARIEDASRVFDVFLRQLAEEFARRAGTENDLQKNLGGLESDLQSWGEGVVFLYTLVGEDRYRVILLTPDTQIDGKTEIEAAKLNEKIEAFRQAVQNPRLDPRPLGKELYDILIGPIEKHLEGARAKTLLWSLDGNLRLLPLAALWDGRQYFGQKYQNVTVTLASRTRLGDADTPNWRALALGVSEAKKVKEPDGTRELFFAALPAVKAELLSIIQSEQSPNGVLPGRRLIDAEFNEPALEAQLLQGYKVVHIASHFSLNAGDSTKSFLLLGDGNVLTVDAIRHRPELKFNGVELLTLSACQTAVVGKDSSGKEIEGFGYVAQQNGAKAILASLWSVADDSTQLFMSRFYRLRKERPQLTKAAALQLAQQEMIEGKLQPLTAGDKRRDTGEIPGSQKNATTYKTDPKKPYAHPYYWSPFILIGNWR
jgi:CHAT domain-containing protein/Tfp pilus assembly protein PilF